MNDGRAGLGQQCHEIDAGAKRVKWQMPDVDELSAWHTDGAESSL